MVVAYDGGGFRGFAPNVGVRTVLGTLDEAIAKVVRSPIQLAGAGRTDAGVHAWGQVVSGELPADIDLGDLQRRLNRLCGPQISVRSIEWAPEGFHARFSATSRTYRYHIWNDPAPNPLLAGQSWQIDRPLALWAMKASSDVLIGEHDFSSFCRRPDPIIDPDTGEERPVSLIRRLLSIDWIVVEGPLLRCELTASSFCHQMVRSLVGTMVEIGLGRRSPAEMGLILRSRDRSTIPTVAPPQGLVLWSVSYEGQRWDQP
jgi:tRNA pseudouridine38-40 synthase